MPANFGEVLRSLLDWSSACGERRPQPAISLQHLLARVNRLPEIGAAVLLAWLISGFLPASAQDFVSLKDPPIVLFNGIHYDGFYPWLVGSKYNDPRRVFTVTNQLRRISGDGLGYLAT